MLAKSCRRLAPITTESTGTWATPDWSKYFRRQKEGRISPWHDIPLVASPSLRPGALPLFNYVNEIPKGTREKMEVNLKAEHNPIRQDIKKGQLRYFTYGDIPFNYGCLPQTWEDPSHPDALTGNKGDGDPLDVVLLTEQAFDIGAVVPVQVLGVLAMIDEGETDWKLLAYPASEVGHWEACDFKVSGTVVEPMRHWFRYYKTTDGKPENVFDFGGALLSSEDAMRVIDECARSYQNLIGGKVDPAVAGKLWLPPKV